MKAQKHIGYALLAAAAMLVATPAMAADGRITGHVTAKKAKYVRNVVVYLTGVTTKAPTKPKKMDQTNQRFKPRVLPVVKGTTVEFLNNDNTGHNVYSPDGEKYDLGTWPKGETRKYTFNKLGAYTQLCQMHPQMLAYVVVVPNRYFARTKKDGSFTIKNVPPGKYTLTVWSEKRKGEPVTVTVTSGADTSVDVPLKR